MQFSLRSASHATFAAPVHFVRQANSRTGNDLATGGPPHRRSSSRVPSRDLWDDEHDHFSV
ncbi:hypothetical protein SCLCIDRAFT_1206869 [Scleroderma citrinum Foug A]|uniref:Uncharacterized protein n=1 Tax=Scleroderma citrinum Foug A TaxID=1036808 RepID=A0A0C3EDH0_9AGAM|nr:hypothetical protein SCLCIDRAFT_1206869 [Scleroderma citrinum Foug A]